MMHRGIRTVEISLFDAVLSEEMGRHGKEKGDKTNFKCGSS